MSIFKQSRYIALLLGVILVCFSAIVLLDQGAVSEGKQNRIQLVKLQSSGLSANMPLTLKEKEDQKRTGNKVHSKLDILAAGKAEWINAGDFITKSKSAPSTVPVKAAVITTPPAKGIQAVSQKVTTSQQHPPTTLFFTRTELLSQELQDKATWQYAVSEEEMHLLQKIVMAEAEGEPYQGKVAVANVVLNRLRSANFPDTIKEVIYQRSQFSPVANGRLKRVKPDQDSINAVNAALSGVKKVSDDTYFFLSLKLAQDLTVHHTRKYAKTIGNHTFYK
ncbi:cell wall hydrolase [Paenibacillus wynnii]|uniref:cell wall hydrolase n=1 Tax=Paenibacillus wynnii TaxID=268407 RepID=UPI0027918326|nr:cell wall hydrolase [Paenibacillus wynnii]MDQ0193995.1 N-acetylmuramoyl-L-alanine amidase [Paenibacillus wynnii]